MAQSKDMTSIAEIRTFSYSETVEGSIQDPSHGYFNFFLDEGGFARGRFHEAQTAGGYRRIGDILYVPAGLTLEAIVAPGLYRSVACHVDAGRFPADLSELSEHAIVQGLDVRSAEVRRGLTRIADELLRPGLASPLVIDAAATLLAVDVTRSLCAIPDKPRKRGGLTNRQLARLKDRIHSALPAATIAELAGNCDLSGRHLSRAFLQETGKTIGKYVKEANFARAVGLLTSTDLPIKQIAAQIGFSNGASFAYAFRRKSGCSPREFRKRHG